MRVIHIGLVFYALLSSKGIVLGVPSTTISQTAPVGVTLTDAEKVQLLEAENSRLTAELGSFRAQCQEDWQKVMDDLRDAKEDFGEQQARLNAAERRIENLVAQMKLQAELRSQDQATIANLNRQLLDAQSELAVQRRTNAALEGEVIRCEEAMRVNGSVEVQKLIHQWTGEDQAMISSLNQQVQDLESENRMLAATNSQLDEQLQRNQDTIGRLSKEMGELRNDLKEEEMDSLQAEYEVDTLEVELKHQEDLLKQCQEELKTLTPPAQWSPRDVGDQDNGQVYGNNGNDTDNNGDDLDRRGLKIHLDNDSFSKNGGSKAQARARRTLKVDNSNKRVIKPDNKYLKRKV